MNRPHRFDYWKARERRLKAESFGEWEEAQYWLLQQLAVEHREEARERHETMFILEFAGVLAAIAGVICALLLLYSAPF